MNAADQNEHRVYLGIGSNIDPEENLPRAIELLRRLVRVEEVSRVWQTPPLGGAGPDFLNAAVRVRTNLSPQDLKNRVIRNIESQLGRVRTEDKYAPRTIDLDILLVDGETCEPNIWVYAFLAAPLADLLPEYRNNKTGENLAQAAHRLARKVRIAVTEDLLVGPVAAPDSDLEHRTRAA